MSDVKTLAETLAIAVLKGDIVAAYALADKLMEDRDGNPVMRELDRLTKEGGNPDLANDGYAVFWWEETQAFLNRLGVDVNLRTIDITIRLTAGEVVAINHNYQALDMEGHVVRGEGP